MHIRMRAKKNSFNHFGLAHLVYDIDFKGANSYTKWARLEQKNQLFCSHFCINQAISLKFSGFVYHMSVLN